MKVKVKALLVFKDCPNKFSDFYKEEFPFGEVLEVKEGVLYGVNGGVQYTSREYPNCVRTGVCTLLFEEV